MELDAEVYKTVLENLPVGVYVVDTNRRIVSWNAGAEHLTGYLRQEVIGRCCAEDLLMHCDLERNILCGNGCPLEGSMRDGKARETDVYLLHKEGQRIPVRVYAFPLRNQDGAITGCAECFAPRTVLPAAPLYTPPTGGMTTDEGTDLPDRAGILGWLAAALRDFEKTGARFAVLRIAVDDLDDLLHKDGRKAVDTVLYATGQTLRANVGPADMVGKWSADSFMVVLAGCTGPALARAAETFSRLTRAEGVPWWGDRLSAAVSMGGTVVRPEDTPDSLVARATAALTAGQAGDGGEILVL